MLRRLAVAFIAIFLPLTWSAVPVLAAKHSGGGGGSSTPVGNDISWPQCGKTNPSGQAFGIVGVNGGLANNINGCLATQLDWAAASSGATDQAKAQLYINTANPGNLGVADWPASGSTPYNYCDGTDSQACAWQYGWNMAYQDDHSFFQPAAGFAGVSSSASNYSWWLDVETGNSWESGTDGQLRNAAVLQGMSDYFFSVGARVGIYSTSYQWGKIAGTNNPNSEFTGIPSWIPGARTQSAAKSNCSLPPLTTNGKVSITQYVSSGYDYDYSCL